MNVAHGILNLEFIANLFKFRSTEKETQVGNLTDVGLLFSYSYIKKRHSKECLFVAYPHERR